MPSNTVIPAETIQKCILFIRSHKVILDATLAELYGVETKALVRAVRRNLRRFPADFMFTLSASEWANLRYQFGTSSGHGGRRYRPYAFTEQGVAMLSSVLNSRRAVSINVVIMRAFVHLRELLSTHHELATKLAELEKRFEGHDAAIANLFEAIRQLLAHPEPSHNRKIGYHRGNR
jgi:ORF6N domain